MDRQTTSFQVNLKFGAHCMWRKHTIKDDPSLNGIHLLPGVVDCTVLSNIASNITLPVVVIRPQKSHPSHPLQKHLRKFVFFLILILSTIFNPLNLLLPLCRYITTKCCLIDQNMYVHTFRIITAYLNLLRVSCMLVPEKGLKPLARE